VVQSGRSWWLRNFIWLDCELDFFSVLVRLGELFLRFFLGAHARLD
jgi:hypothetical protein